MRVGRNPYLHQKVEGQQKLLEAMTVVFIPQCSGYFENALEILKYTIESLWLHTADDFDLMVFDNNSCREVQDFLIAMKEQGKINTLILSDKNVGKVGALNRLAPITRSKYVCFFDSDVLFHPSWFTESRKVLDTIPGAGMVTGISERLQNQYFNSTAYTLLQNQPNVQIHEGEFMAIEEHGLVAEGLGAAQEKYLQDIAPLKDIKISVGDCSAYLGAKHFQFLTKREILQSLIPFHEDVVMGKLKEVDKQNMAEVGLTGDFQIDARMDGAGYLRLSTTKICVEHIGNAITPRMARILQRYFRENITSDKNGSKSSVLENKFIKKVLLKIYNKIFRIYFK